MKKRRMIALTCLAGSAALFAVTTIATAQEQTFFSKRLGAIESPAVVRYSCRGTAVRAVADAGDENLRTTSAVFGSGAGGGEGAQFDKTPVLTSTVSLKDGDCLNAHLSAIVGGPIYGVSGLALFQVTLTGAGIAPRHMYGHYETPYGVAAPAVALGAEPDVDMLGANFIQHVGTGTHDVPPGTYKVNVWWAGSPGGSGAIGAAFVLKLYTS